MKVKVFRLVVLSSLLGSGIPGYGAEIALSFDDAPWGRSGVFGGLERTRVLIDKLREAKVSQVAIFSVAKRAISTRGKKQLEMYAKAGHVIANHSYSHFDLRKTKASVYVEDVKKAHNILNKFPGFAKWFRYPMLHEGKTENKRDAVRTALSEMGYMNGYVTVDNYDWYMEALLQRALRKGKKIDFQKLRALYVTILTQGVEFYDGIAKKVLGRSPKHVLLLHENDLAALYIGDLVERLRKNGWSVISPIEAYKDPIASVVPHTLLNGQGRVAAIAKAKGYKGSVVHPSESEPFLEKLFVERGITSPPL